MVATQSYHEERPNPLDLVEELAAANQWHWERSNDSELMMEIAGRWCDCHMSFLWADDVSAMFFSCHIGQKVPEPKRAAVHELLALYNETLWLGHFDINSEDWSPLFRHTLALRGVSAPSVELLEDLVDTAQTECDRFFLALQLVVWGGQPVATAMTAAMMDTQGEA